MKKVVLLGTAPLSKDLVPYDDQSYEIWVCSAGNMTVAKRITRWFELHAMVELEATENKSWSSNYIAWLRQQTFPVWMLEKNELVPQAQIFPAKELLKEFGREWFTSSIAWMQALAIYEKFEEIAIIGVDMAADHEHYTGQRAGCRRFIEIAKERDIKVTIPWESCLGNPPPIYGLSEATPMGRRVNVTEAMLTQKRVELVQQVERLTMERCFFDGALEQLRYIKRTFLNGEDAFDHMNLMPEIEKAAKASVDANMPSKATVTPEINPSVASFGGNGSFYPAAAQGHVSLTPPPPIGD